MVNQENEQDSIDGVGAFFSGAPAILLNWVRKYSETLDNLSGAVVSGKEQKSFANTGISVIDIGSGLPEKLELQYCLKKYLWLEKAFLEKKIDETSIFLDTSSQCIYCIHYGMIEDGKKKDTFSLESIAQEIFRVQRRIKTILVTPEFSQEDKKMRIASHIEGALLILAAAKGILKPGINSVPLRISTFFPEERMSLSGGDKCIIVTIDVQSLFRF